jgi:hypothetical protein
MEKIGETNNEKDYKDDNKNINEEETELYHSGRLSQLNSLNSDESLRKYEKLRKEEMNKYKKEKIKKNKKDKNDYSNCPKDETPYIEYSIPSKKDNTEKLTKFEKLI